jgi:hypothetical protein
MWKCIENTVYWEYNVLRLQCIENTVYWEYNILSLQYIENTMYWDYNVIISIFLKASLQDSLTPVFMILIILFCKINNLLIFEDVL